MGIRIEAYLDGRMIDRVDVPSVTKKEWDGGTVDQSSYLDAIKSEQKDRFTQDQIGSFTFKVLSI